MTKKGIEHFPELGDWGDQELENFGYRRVSVSIFDHWLTFDELEANPLASLKRARANGLEPVYQEQNRRFRDFYRIVFGNGVYRLTGSRSNPHVVWHSGWDRRLKKAVVAMVEDRTWGAGFYVPAHSLRISCGDFRTDTMLFEKGADGEAIRTLASHYGLNFLT